jgi:predicted anti-sigma-YlaC factor YlaD
MYRNKPELNSFSSSLRACLLVFFYSLMLNGCSLRQIAIDQVSDALTSGGDAFASDNDPNLVRDASPFSLKLMESLLAGNPKHRGLLLTLSKGFTQYAYAYVQLHADELEENDIATAYSERERAKRMYLRARDYGLRGLSLQQPDFIEQLRVDPQITVNKAHPSDIELLYWTGVSWAAAVSLGKDDPYLIADLPSIDALIMRAYEIDETFDNGSLHVFLINYEMSRKSINPDAVDMAREHFERAVELSNGMQVAPYVALAESVAITEQNRSEFTSLLSHALEIDVDTHTSWRLTNLIMQQRAQWLLTRSDEYFTE